ncbi:hypothetical protein [Chryseobacterium sp. T20]
MEERKLDVGRNITPYNQPYFYDPKLPTPNFLPPASSPLNNINNP